MTVYRIFSKDGNKPLRSKRTGMWSKYSLAASFLRRQPNAEDYYIVEYDLVPVRG